MIARRRLLVILAVVVFFAGFALLVVVLTSKAPEPQPQMRVFEYDGCFAVVFVAAERRACVVLKIPGQLSDIPSDYQHTNGPIKLRIYYFPTERGVAIAEWNSVDPGVICCFDRRLSLTTGAVAVVEFPAGEPWMCRVVQSKTALDAITAKEVKGLIAQF